MAAQDTAPASKPLGAGFELTMTRTFKAPVELLFDCFTQIDHFAKWWGPLGCENVVHELDARPGGKISLLMSGPGFSHTMGGEFVEIERPRRLVFRTMAFEAPDGGWGIVNRITLTFEDLGDMTRLHMHTFVERAEGELVLGALGGMKAGWGQSMERLGDLVGGGGKLDVEILDRRVVVTRAFDASPEAVWRALVEPELFVRWWCAGGGEIEGMDVRPGGEWRLRLTGADGERHLFWGEYVTVEPPTRLVMTQGFDDHQPIEVVHDLIDEWGRTTLRRTVNFPDNTYRDGMMGSGFERGAAETYDALAALLAES